MCDITPQHIPFLVFKFIDTPTLRYSDPCIQSGRWSIFEVKLKENSTSYSLKVGRDLKFDIFRILADIVNWKGYNPSNIFLPESF